MIILRKSNGCF